MAIKINDIPAGGLTREFAQKLDLFNEGAPSTEFRAVLGIEPKGGGLIHVTGRVQAEPILECSRCLRNFPFKIDSELDVHLSPVNAMERTPERELTGGELETEFYEGDEIDPAGLIKEQLLISLPMVPVHSPGCKGLCPSCGSDLNEGDCACGKKGDDFGPFAGLKDLLKK